MTINAKRVQRVAAVTVVLYFIGYTALCWGLDLTMPGKHETQMRLRLFFDAGVVGGVLAFICSCALWRSHRRLAIIGFIACLAFAIWSALPRL